MTKNEWEVCDDVKSMIEFLWEQEPYLSIREKFISYPPKENWKEYLKYELPLYQFYLESCSNIWDLLPQEESRKGIELAQEFASGKVSWDAVSEYNWHTEGAAFFIEYNSNPDKIAVWCKDVESIPQKKINKMINAKETMEITNARDVLLNAAYFADHAMMYPSIHPKGPPTRYTEFMFADVLRKHVSYPKWHNGVVKNA